MKILRETQEYFYYALAVLTPRILLQHPLQPSPVDNEITIAYLIYINLHQERRTTQSVIIISNSESVRFRIHAPVHAPWCLTRLTMVGSVPT